MPNFYDIAENTRRRNRSNFTPGADINYEYGPFGANAPNSAPAGWQGQSSFIPGDYYVPPGLQQDPQFNPYENEDANQFWYEEADPTKQYTSHAAALEVTGGDPEMERKVAIMNYEAAQKKQQQRQALAMKILQEQRMRERNRMTAFGQQQQRQMQWQAAQDKKQEARDDAAVKAYGVSGLHRYAADPTPQNKRTIMRGFKGTSEEQAAYGWALDSAARTEADYQDKVEDEAFKEREQGYKRAAGYLRTGSPTGWAGKGVKEGDYPEFESDFVEDARAWNTIADDHKKTADVILKTYKNYENKLTPTLIRDNPKSAGEIRAEMDRMKSRNAIYFTEPAARLDTNGNVVGTDYLNPFEEGKGRAKSHRWDLKDLYAPGGESPEPSPLPVSGTPQPAIPTRPGMTQQRPPRWQAAYDRLDPDPDGGPFGGYTGELDDRKWSEAKIPYPKWPEAVKHAKSERQAAWREEMESFHDANRTDEQRAIIKQSEERGQAWEDKLAAGATRREEAEREQAQSRQADKERNEEIMLNKWAQANPLQEQAQEAYTSQELQRVDAIVDASQVAEQAQALFDNGDYAKAQENAEIALNLDPTNQEAIATLGLLQDFYKKLADERYGSSSSEAGEFGWATESTPLSPANIAPPGTPPPAPTPTPTPTPTPIPTPTTSTNALTADVTQTGTNVPPAVVARTGTNALTADVIQPDQPDDDWLTSLPEEDQIKMVTNALNFADQQRRDSIVAISYEQWKDEVEKEAARIAFPDEDLGVALSRMNTQDWIDGANLGYLRSKAMSNVRSKFRIEGRDNPNQAGDNRRRAIDLIRQGR